MKKLYIFFVLTFGYSIVSAQEFRKFKFDIASGYANPMVSGSKTGGSMGGGVLIAFEPKFALSDKFSIGLRGEVSLLASVAGFNYSVSDTLSEFPEGEASMKATSSYAITGDYYFTTSNLRPFIGGGVGMFSVGGISSSMDTVSAEGDVATGTKIGFIPRAGLEFRHIRLAVEYDMIGKVNKQNFNYLGVKLGFYIGGGRIGGGGPGGRGSGRRSPANREDFM